METAVVLAIIGVVALLFFVIRMTMHGGTEPRHEERTSGPGVGPRGEVSGRAREPQSMERQGGVPTITVTYSVSRPSISVSTSGGYDRDSEGSFWEMPSPRPVKALLWLDYEDAHGERSQRKVEVRQFGEYNGNVMLVGHCHLRNAMRTFRSDRILECIDEETGEVVDNVGAHLTRRYEASPEASRDRLLEEEFDTLRILLYVGKADGQLRAPEKAIIRETCVALSKDSRLTDEVITGLLNSMSVPTLQAFKMAVGRIAKREEGARSVVMGAAERMVATQKTVAPAEQEALDYMRERFTPSAPKPRGRPKKATVQEGVETSAGTGPIPADDKT